MKMWFNYIDRLVGPWVIKTVGWGEKRMFEPIGTLPQEVEKHGCRIGLFRSGLQPLSFFWHVRKFTKSYC